MMRPLVRVLVAEDFEPFRRFLISSLQTKPGVQVISEAFDGLEAIQKAQELQPDLILLDIGMPHLNGLEAAKRIRQLSPKAKILFVSQESSVDLVREALRIGAFGYIIKTDAGSELLPGVEAVLNGDVFVSSRLADRVFPAPSSPQHRENRHEIGIYSDDESLLNHLASFVENTVRSGNSAVVVATAAHREALLSRVQSRGADISSAIEQGRYLTLDAEEALPGFMRDGMPDPVRFIMSFGDCIQRAATASKRKNGRVALFGECARLLWEAGNPEAAIAVEKLGNEQILPTYDVDILCGYFSDTFQTGVGNQILARVCAEHSSVYSE